MLVKHEILPNAFHFSAVFFFIVLVGLLWDCLDPSDKEWSFFFLSIGLVEQSREKGRWGRTTEGTRGGLFHVNEVDLACSRFCLSVSVRVADVMSGGESNRVFVFLRGKL